MLLAQSSEQQNCMLGTETLLQLSLPGLSRLGRETFSSARFSNGSRVLHCLCVLNNPNAGENQPEHHSGMSLCPQLAKSRTCESQFIVLSLGRALFFHCSCLVVLLNMKSVCTPRECIPDQLFLHSFQDVKTTMAPQHGCFLCSHKQTQQQSWRCGRCGSCSAVCSVESGYDISSQIW